MNSKIFGLLASGLVASTSALLGGCALMPDGRGTYGYVAQPQPYYANSGGDVYGGYPVPPQGTPANFNVAANERNLFLNGSAPTYGVRTGGLTLRFQQRPDGTPMGEIAYAACIGSTCTVPTAMGRPMSTVDRTNGEVVAIIPPMGGPDMQSAGNTAWHESGPIPPTEHLVITMIAYRVGDGVGAAPLARLTQHIGRWPQVTATGPIQLHPSTFGITL